MKKDPRDQLETLLGKDTVLELEALDLPSLNKRIAEANEAISETKRELDSNENYVKIVEDKKLLESGYREVKKRQNAVIKLCLELRK